MTVILRVSSVALHYNSFLITRKTESELFLERFIAYFVGDRHAL